METLFCEHNLQLINKIDILINKTNIKKVNQKKEQKRAKWGLAIFRTFINKKKFCNVTFFSSKTCNLQKMKSIKIHRVLEQGP